MSVIKNLYFCDIPVYRLSKDSWRIEYEKYQQDHAWPEWYEPDRDQKAACNQYLLKSFGGYWEFNEIIGYIKLYFSGNDILGEYYAGYNKKCVKSNKKVFRYITHKLAYEVRLPSTLSQSYNNAKIFECVLLYLEKCQEYFNKKFKHRKQSVYVDASKLEAIGRYIDWATLLKDNGSKPSDNNPPSMEILSKHFPNLSDDELAG